MAQRDIDIVMRVEDEFLKGQLGDVQVGLVVQLIEQLKLRFGDGFTVEGCLTALKRLSESASDFHEEIEKASKSQPE